MIKFNLENRVAIVTGGAQGFGLAITERFIQSGAKVVIWDIDEDEAKKAISKINSKYLIYQIVDVTDFESVSKKLKEVENLFGKIDILVNNAAHDDRHDWTDITEEYWDERFATNLRHHFFTIQSVAQDMIQKGGGSIINIGSNSWWEAVGNFPAYATAKSAVHGLTRTLARDLGKHRIRVNTVVPGWIMTERQKDLWVTPEGLENQMKRQCLPDLIEPVYVARMVLFLASDDAVMCTANNYMVEAGSI